MGEKAGKVGTTQHSQKIADKEESVSQKERKELEKVIMARSEYRREKARKDFEEEMRFNAEKEEICQN